MSAYAGFNTPANILDIINKDVKGGSKVSWVRSQSALGDSYPDSTLD